MALKLTMRNQPTAATFREKLELHRPQRNEQRAKVAELRAHQDAAADDPAAYAKIGREIVAAETELRRLETVVGACEAALPLAEAEEHRQGLLGRKSELLKRDRQADLNFRRANELGAELAGILQWFADDERETEALCSELRNIGEHEIHCARLRHCYANDLGHGDPLGTTVIPVFGDQYARHWPKPRSRALV